MWKIKLGQINETGLNFYVKGALELERITESSKHVSMFQSFFDLLINKTISLEVSTLQILTTPFFEMF